MYFRLTYHAQTVYYHAKYLKVIFMKFNIRKLNCYMDFTSKLFVISCCSISLSIRAL